MKLISQFMVMFLLAGCTLGGEVTNKFGTILANKVLIGTISNSMDVGVTVGSLTGMPTRITAIEARTSVWNTASSTSINATNRIALVEARTSVWNQASIASINAIHRITCIEARTSVWNQASSNATLALQGLNSRPTYLVVTDIVNDAISEIPIPPYDQTKIKTVDSNQWVTIVTTNLVMYSVKTETTTRLVCTDDGMKDWGEVDGVWDWRYPPFANSTVDFPFSIDGWEGNITEYSGIQFYDVMSPFGSHWGNFQGGLEVPATLISWIGGVPGSAVISNSPLSIVTTNIIKTFATTDDVANKRMTRVESEDGNRWIDGTGGVWRVDYTYSYSWRMRIIDRAYDEVWNNLTYPLQEGFWPNGDMFVNNNTYVDGEGIYYLEVQFGIFSEATAWFTIILLGSGDEHLTLTPYFGASTGYAYMDLIKTPITATTNLIDGVAWKSDIAEPVHFGPVIDGKRAFTFTDGTNFFYVNVNWVTNAITTN